MLHTCMFISQTKADFCLYCVIKLVTSRCQGANQSQLLSDDIEIRDQCEETECQPEPSQFVSMQWHTLLKCPQPGCNMVAKRS